MACVWAIAKMCRYETRLERIDSKWGARRPCQVFKEGLCGKRGRQCVLGRDMNEEQERGEMRQQRVVGEGSAIALCSHHGHETLQSLTGDGRDEGPMARNRDDDGPGADVDSDDDDEGAARRRRREEEREEREKRWSPLRPTTTKANNLTRPRSACRAWACPSTANTNFKHTRTSAPQYQK